MRGNEHRLFGPHNVRGQRYESTDCKCLWRRCQERIGGQTGTIEDQRSIKSLSKEYAMLIRAGYEICFELPQQSPMLLMLYLHPSRDATTRRKDQLEVLPWSPVSSYIDSYGNRCGRLVASAGQLTLRNEVEVEDCGLPELQYPNSPQHQVQDLPNEAVLFLLASRYPSLDRGSASSFGEASELPSRI